MTRPVLRTTPLAMKQFFLTMLGVFAGLLAFFLISIVILFGFIGAAISSASSSEPAPHNTVLELDLREGVTDQAPSNPFAIFGGSGLSTLQIVDTLAQAEDDNRVKVLLIRLPEGGITPAAAVLGRAGCGDQRGVDGRAVLEQQPFGRQRAIESSLKNPRNPHKHWVFGVIADSRNSQFDFQ